MNNWNEIKEVQQKIEKVCGLIENDEYSLELFELLKEIQKLAARLFEFEEELNIKNISMLNKEKLNDILNDIIDGTTRRDSVFLIDTLKYGFQEEIKEIRDKIEDIQ